MGHYGVSGKHVSDEGSLELPLMQRQRLAGEGPECAGAAAGARMARANTHWYLLTSMHGQAPLECRMLGERQDMGWAELSVPGQGSWYPLPDYYRAVMRLDLGVLGSLELMSSITI